MLLGVKTFDWVNFKADAQKETRQANPSVTSLEEFPYGD